MYKQRLDDEKAVLALLQPPLPEPAVYAEWYVLLQTFVLLFMLIVVLCVKVRARIETTSLGS